MVFEDTKSTWVYRKDDNHVISIPDGLAGSYANNNLANMIVFEAELTNPRKINSSPVGGVKFICTGLNCSTYVFGASAVGVCPECGHEGDQVNPDMVRAFIEWYETARSRPVANR